MGDQKERRLLLEKPGIKSESVASQGRTNHAGGTQSGYGDGDALSQINKFANPSDPDQEHILKELVHIPTCTNEHSTAFSPLFSRPSSPPLLPWPPTSKNMCTNSPRISIPGWLFQISQTDLHYKKDKRQEEEEEEEEKEGVELQVDIPVPFFPQSRVRARRDRNPHNFTPKVVKWWDGCMSGEGWMSICES